MSCDCHPCRKPAKSEMDAIDLAQQLQIDGNEKRDDAQQAQIERQGFIVKALLFINTAAALAQVAECYKIWTGGFR